MDLGHWTTELEVPESFYGFIYRIINAHSGRSYIGKKQAKTIKKLKPLKGKKQHRRVEKDTDWRTYTGSSTELNEDIKKLGKESFKFIIERFCNSKWELAYFEAATQFAENVLFQPNLYYNSIINLRINKAPKLVLEQYEKQHNQP